MKQNNIQIDSFLQKVSFDIELHYYAMGNGYPIFAVNGYGMSANFWAQPFVLGLARTHRVFLVDYPSINSKYNKNNISVEDIAESIVNLAKCLGYAKFDMMGWSMGGAIATAVALNHPISVRSLLLISPVMPILYDKPETDGLDFKAHSLNELQHKIFYLNFYNYTQDQYNYYMSQTLDSEEAIISTRASNKLLIEALYNWKNNPDNYLKFKQSSTPALFMLPQYETILTPGLQIQTIAAYPDNKEVHQIPDTGHAPFYQQARMLVDLINNFTGKLVC